jgi:sugar phosphate isomerase/epimerase
MMPNTTRRGFLGAGLAAVPALSFGNTAGVPFKLGVATYSLRKLSRTDAIAAIRKMGVTHVSIKEFHLRYNSTPAEIRAGVQEFQDAGLTILSGGNVGMREDTIDGLRQWFEYAKACGMPMMVCAPTQKNVHLVERLVKEYGIKAAIHNHGPEDKEFPTPESVLKAIKGMDPRMGLCIDIGHTTRTGVDVVQSIAEAGPRLLDMHVKDLRDLMDKDSQCAVGEGAMPMEAIFRQLKKMNYSGGCMLEYEINAGNPVPGMITSFNNMRKVLAKIQS